MREHATFSIHLDPRFPTDAVRTIAARLANAGVLIPGFIPASNGFLALETMLYERHLEGNEIILLPDRNLVTRMAAVARRGGYQRIDKPTEIAIDLMALAQAMNFDIEPSIAFHELAHRKDNEHANEELRWFRTANQSQPDAWIEMALRGRGDYLLSTPKPVLSHDLAKPLARWRRNYVVALKVAATELGPGTARSKALHVLDWMLSDFIVAGPGAMFAVMYLSPGSSRAGMLKQLRSSDREKAIAGVRNAAWDITYLSDFTRRVSSPESPDHRYILATADKLLAELAGLVISDASTLAELREMLLPRMVPWWRADAELVASSLVRTLEVAACRNPPLGVKGRQDPVGDAISSGELLVRSWRPTS